MTIVNGPLVWIVDFITNENHWKKYDSMSKKIVHKQGEDWTFKSTEEFQVSMDNSIMKYLPKSTQRLPGVDLKFDWCVYTEDKFSYYICKKAEGKSWEECFIILPLVSDPDKFLVYMFSNFKTGINFIENAPTPHQVETYYLDQRMLFIWDLRVYLSKQPAPENRASSALKMNRSSSVKNKIGSDGVVYKYPPSDSSIILGEGEVSSLKERMPHYHWTKAGHLWCNDA